MDSRRTESRFGSGMGEIPMPLPEAQPPAPKPAPVHVQHLRSVERSATQTQSFAAIPSADSSRNPVDSPPIPAPAAYGFQQPAAKGVGFLTLAIGLIATAAASTWLAGRLASNEINKVAATYVDQKALGEANAAFLEFQGKTRTHITVLEEQVRKLSERLAATQSAAESLKVAAVAPPTKAMASKMAASAKAEETLAKNKAAKKAQVAKASKAALAKASAARLKKKKAEKAAARPSQSEISDLGLGADNSATAASYSDPMPSVPQPPGLDNHDLPPPPAD